MESKHKIVEQFAKEAVDFSSQYGSESSISYTVSNIAQESSVYPKYGDFTQACVLRTYGPWWLQAPSAERCFTKTPTTFISQDYIDLSYEKKVFPTAVEIYETYNPGTVVRIVACDSDPVEGTSTDHVRWFVLWEGTSNYRRARSHIFSPKLQQCPFPTNLVRLEFNCMHCDYYTELDAVKLTGYICTLESAPNYITQNGESTPNTATNATVKSSWDNNLCLPCLRTSRPNSSESQKSLSNDLSKTCDSSLLHIGNSDCDRVGSPVSPAEIITQGIAQLHIQDGLSAALDVSDNGCFDLLPGEVIHQIVSYLDLPSLCNLASACQLFYRHCYDPYQYSELNLQPYWPQVTSSTLIGLASRCAHLQRLNLAWCGNYHHITTQGYTNFIQACGKKLTCLKLSCCKFINSDTLKTTVKVCRNLQELHLQCCRNIGGDDFKELSNLQDLQHLNLYRTFVSDSAVLAIIRSCKRLEHVNLGSCKEIKNFDDVCQALGENCKHLKTLDSWRAKHLTPSGLRYLHENCHLLEELDLGWCPQVQCSSGCIVTLVEKCKRIKKLFLTANRTVSDRELDAIARNLRDLEQMDILGTNDVTEQSVFKVINECKKLKFFDLSFCGRLRNDIVSGWKGTYPDVSIKRSFQEQVAEEVDEALE